MTASRISIPRVALAFLVCECTRRTNAFPPARFHCLAITSNSGSSSFRTPLQRDRDAMLPSILLSLRGGSSASALRVSTKLQAETRKDGAYYSAAAYHLVWSPGFVKKLVSSTLGLFFLRFMLMRSGLAPQFVASHCDNTLTPATTNPSLLAKTAELLILPLLSSSCCALQLIINSVSGIGCAGFNTVLGPIRPYFLSFLLYSTVISFPGVGIGHWIQTALFSFVLSLLPELLYVWNERTVSKKPMSVHPGAGVSATVELIIPSMGCVACVNKVDNSIQKSCKSENLIESRSWLTENPKGGRAKFALMAGSKRDVDKIVHTILESVSNAGFPCSVELEVIETNSISTS